MINSNCDQKFIQWLQESSPSDVCRKFGLKLVELEHISGVSKQTLINWHKKKPHLFNCVIRGASEIKK